MKRPLVVLLLLLLITSPLLTADPQQPQDEYPKVALVLSGGAALGFAHIGVLEVIEELGIPIDIVVGTSMGGIVGGLYSIGYTPCEIREIAEDTDWLDLFLPTSSPYDYYFGPVIDNEYNILSFSFDEHGFGSILGFVSDQKILSLLSKVTAKVSHIDDFDQFYKPFRTVGVDILTGDVITFDSGNITDALRATMSIPTLFAPYRIGDRYYIDGGSKNNLPVDVALEMGADIVIAVDVDAEAISDYRDISSTIDIFTQYIMITLDSNEEEHEEMADIIIYPDMTDLNVALFTEHEEFIKRGRDAAEEMKDDLIAIRDEISEDRDTICQDPERKGYYSSLSTPRINKISIGIEDDLFPFSLFYDVERSTLNDHTVDLIERSINRVVSTGRYDSISYSLIESHSSEYEFDLMLHPVLSERGRHSIGLGFSFDGGFSGSLDEAWYLDPALTTSMVFTELFGTQAYVSFDMKISDQFKADLELFAPLGSIGYLHPSFNLYNEEISDDEGNISRSILLSGTQEIGFLYGKFTEFGFDISQYISWLLTEEESGTDVQTDIELVYGPSFSWQDSRHHRFIHEGIIHKSSIDFSILEPEDWYHRFCIEHDHHLPITDYGTFSYDFLIGSYKGKFTNRQMSFDIGGWDGIPGYLTSKEVYDDAFLAGAAYQHRFKTLSDLIGADIYGIAQFRLGNGWDEFPECCDLDLKFGNAVGIGINSFFGDVILGAGINQDAQIAYYILMN